MQNIDSNLPNISVNCNPESLPMWMRSGISSYFEALEVSKHKWYHVVTNCLCHVFSPSVFTKSKQKLSKRAKRQFSNNLLHGLR